MRLGDAAGKDCIGDADDCEDATSGRGLFAPASGRGGDAAAAAVTLVLTASRSVVRINSLHSSPTDTLKRTPTNCCTLDVSNIAGRADSFTIARTSSDTTFAFNIYYEMYAR
jgi:hypothetical protein